MRGHELVRFVLDDELQRSILLRPIPYLASLRDSLCNARRQRKSENDLLNAKNQQTATSAEATAQLTMKVRTFYVYFVLMCSFAFTHIGVTDAYDSTPCSPSSSIPCSPKGWRW